jgi:potassium channel subfamily K, other eukaryote
MALNATAAGPLVDEPKDGGELIWSQAFWYGTWAAILYFIVASLMVITVYGAYVGHYDKDFNLTSSQRTLMLQTIMFLMYLLLGALVFSKIEGWAYLDALYWADVTLFTIGFGEFAAATTLGRALLIPYALIGIISLGLVIGSIRTLVLERGKRRVDARMVEKKRRQMLRRMTKHGRDDILKPIRDDKINATTTSSAHPNLPRDELERRRREFEIMRKIQHDASLRRRWVAMGVSTSTWLLLWLVGAKIFQECEAPYQRWTYFEGFYFAFVSLTTVGYGDRTPVSNAGKSFFVFWSLLALPTMTVLISNAGDTVVKGVRDTTLQLGNVTILPSDKGFTKDIKVIASFISCGKLFADDEEVYELPPGFLGESQPTEGMEEEDEEEEEEEEEEVEECEGREEEEDTVQDEEAAQDQPRSIGVNVTLDDTTPENSEPPIRATQNKSQTTGQPRPPTATTVPSEGRSSFSHIRSPHTTLPTTRAEYHYILISEIASVTKHLKSKPPKKYTYAEWAWFLKLIGEDESSAETHRKANPHVHGKKLAKADSNTTNKTGGGQTEKWSWVGSHSPLMGSQEESEWILQKLTGRLKQELDGVRREHLENRTKSFNPCRE